MESKFKSDKNGEEALSGFLDKYLYSKLVRNRQLDRYERIYEKEQQLQGIDVILHTKGKNINVDEKSTLQYINKDIPTFAMELAYKDKLGWFLNNNLKTDTYFLIWPHATETDLSKINSEDFFFCSCMMIYKKNIRKYIQNFVTDYELFQEIQNIKNGCSTWRKDEKGRYRMPNNNQLYITISKQLQEQPINLVIRKEILKIICCSEIIVEKDNIKFFKK